MTQNDLLENSKSFCQCCISGHPLRELGGALNRRSTLPSARVGSLRSVVLRVDAPTVYLVGIIDCCELILSK